MQSIPGYDNYRVASNGDVWVFINGKFLHTLTPQINNAGYLRINLLSNLGKWRFFLVHRLVAELYKPNIYDLPDVDHIDGNKMNNNYSNLEWVTHSENMKRYYKLKSA